MIGFGTAETYVVRWVFLRALAVVWAVAFLSLLVQVEGLSGAEGIVPAEGWLEGVREARGGMDLGVLPTICWWTGAGTATLVTLCTVGVALAALLAVGVFPGLVSLLLWALYLSLVSVGSPFLNFQWDILLLETGAIAVVLAPWVPWAPGLVRRRPPSRTAMLVLRLLLCKLMFLSGASKLAGGDPNWRDLSALEYHYWTTCLPTWAGWFAHQLPAWFHRASVAGMFALELGCPLLALLPVRRARMAAFFLLVALQVGIAATGNYGFFNLLSVVLCLSLLDDPAILGVLPGRLRERIAAPRTDVWVPLFRRAGAVAFALVWAPLSLWQVQARVLGRDSLPDIAPAALAFVSPFRSVNGYGLFANMTTGRREIEVEGSADGVTWKPYGFRWKPGDPAGRPAFVQPHMPRLDWQMWFAALSDWRRQRWFTSFLERLLEGSPAVLDLLGENPFPDAPPRQVRALAYDYRFTTREERRETGDWWVRERRGLYAPVLERVEGVTRIVPAAPGE